MPGSHGLRYGAVAHEHRVDGRAEKTLDQRCRAGVCSDEIAEGTEDRSFAEDAAFLQQPRRRWSEPDALPLQTFERVELCGETGMQFFGAEQIRACGVLPRARLLEDVASIFGGSGRLRHLRRGNRGGIFRGGKIAARRFSGVEQLTLLRLERRFPRADFVALALDALVIQVCAVQLFAQVPHRTLALLEIGAGRAQTGANFLLMAR